MAFAQALKSFNFVGYDTTYFPFAGHVIRLQNHFVDDAPAIDGGCL